VSNPCRAGFLGPYTQDSKGSGGESFRRPEGVAQEIKAKPILRTDLRKHKPIFKFSYTDKTPGSYLAEQIFLLMKWVAELLNIHESLTE
jgi:hypothetical protein